VTFRSKAPVLAEMAAFLRQYSGGERVPARTVNR